MHPYPVSAPSLPPCPAPTESSPPANHRRGVRRWSALGLAALLALSGSAQIESVTRVTAQPLRYGRTDFLVILRAEWRDPFCSAEVQLDLELTSPAGRALVVPAYYESGASAAPSVWRVRYAPREAGEYRGRFVLTTAGRRQESAALAFTVAPSAKRGFLHAAGPWIFRFDNGEPFRGLGENIGWEARANDDSRYFKALHEHPRFNYDYLLGRLANHGGNFARTWMCAWNLPLEWSQVIDTSRYTSHPGRFNPGAIARLDELVALAEDTDTTLMLTLDPHVSFLGHQWELNPYNRRNGGPAATPAEFFTSEAAKARYRDRLRFLVARWGFSPHVGVWEFFNEIDHVIYEQKPERIPDAVITAWHAEMSAYLHRIDPAGRPVTTSISHREVAGLNAVPSLDFSQKHVYRNTEDLASIIRNAVKRDGKPYVIGEFAYEWDWSKNFADFAPQMARDYKRGLWLGLFSPTPILPLTWWWEYFDDRNLTPTLAGVRTISDQMLAAGHGEFTEVACRAEGASALAVRCGPKTFACVFNPTESPLKVTLRLADARPTVPKADWFNPEDRQWHTGPAVTLVDGECHLPEVALQPGETRIVVLQ